MGKMAIFKRRFVKKYRHSVLDRRLNRTRTAQEIRCLEKALECGVKVPKILFHDKDDLLIVMEYIEGLTIKATITEGSNDLSSLATAIGDAVAMLHSRNIIHGDLTTSNMMMRCDELVIIDFGLAIISASIEDRAVDLYVLERALLSTHSEVSKSLFSMIIERYKTKVSRSKETIDRLAAVQLRGRKRDLSG